MRDRLAARTEREPTGLNDARMHGTHDDLRHSGTGRDDSRSQLAVHGPERTRVGKYVEGDAELVSHLAFVPREAREHRRDGRDRLGTDTRREHLNAELLDEQIPDASTGR